MKNHHIGSTFDSFLKEESILEEIEAKALKQVIALLLEQTLEKKQMTRTEFAKKMHTSRAAVNRLLDPENTAVTLHSIVKATTALGKKLQLRVNDHK